MFKETNVSIRLSKPTKKKNREWIELIYETLEYKLRHNVLRELIKDFSKHIKNYFKNRYGVNVLTVNKINPYINIHVNKGLIQLRYWVLVNNRGVI